MPAAPLSPAVVATLNPGIRCTVVWLRSLGFETTDSGDGETREHPCDRPYPYVSARVEARELVAAAQDLCGCLRGIGVKVVSMTEAFAAGETPRGVAVQASYDPVDGVALLDLIGMCDARFNASASSEG